MFFSLCCRLNELAQALIAVSFTQVSHHAADCYYVSVMFPGVIHPFFFLFTDEKEDTVLGSLPLLSFRIGGVEPSDNITRKFAFKVSDIRVEEQRVLVDLCVIVFHAVDAVGTVEHFMFMQEQVGSL